MHKAVLNIPETLRVRQATDIVDGLARHYSARVTEPIAEEKDEPEAGKPRLRFPRVCDAFVPQSFRVLRYLGKAKSLEDEATWKDLGRRDDLGAFLLSYLSSPYSTETPLVVLGHPGSGKSLLTTVLSAQLMSKHYTPIRVPLREVDAEAGIVAQVEERLARITSINIDSWANLSGAFKNNPPLVILDGYDELLQASGKVFSGYLKDVQIFQKNEAEQGRPVRVIVTSRVTLIDKATIPQGATIVRLLEFNQRQRDRWISIWNQENANYFNEAKVREFALPKEGNNGAAKILSLAEQPLLLLMLALYDSQDNQLRKSKSLDRTILYDSLLRRFVARERAKDRKFEELLASDQQRELDSEMQRLAVAALGMYNRRKLHILSPELNDDIRFFGLERTMSVSAGRPLSQADLLLGSFFFVHKSKAQLKAGAPEHHEETAAFEFLHNTFGEFLTADFILRQAFTEVLSLKALMENEDLRAQLEQRLGAADGLSRAWFASLVYTPLFTRPVVLEMMREWIEHALKRRQLSRQEFLTHLDEIVLNQIKRLLNKREMPSIIRKDIAQEGYRAPFGDHPLLGHIAIYSINLVVLRAILDVAPFTFDESRIGTYEDGTRPWDRLTHVWRSWFALDNLSGVTAVLVANRNGLEITICPKERIQSAESKERLETCLNVAVSLADNISGGLTGLLCFEPSKENLLGIDEIAGRLRSEKIDLEFQLSLKYLIRDSLNVAAGNTKGFCGSASNAIELALRSDKAEELGQIALSVWSGLRRVYYGSTGRKRASTKEAMEVLREAVGPRMAVEVGWRNPPAAMLLYRAAKEIGDFEWINEFRHRFGDLTFRPHRYPLGGTFGRRAQPEFFEGAADERDLLELIERSPDAVAWLQLAREVGGERFMRHVRPEFLERALDPRYLLKLTEWNPQAAVAWLQVVRGAGGERFLRHVGPEFFARRFDRHRLLELSERNPEAALAWLQLVWEAGDERFLRRLEPEFFERAFDPRYLLELTERNPEAALAWLQLAREVGGERLRSLEPEFFARAFDPRYVLGLTERNPEAARAWLQLAREVGGERLRSLEPEFFERAFDPRYLLELTERDPEAGLAWLQLVREAGGERSLRRFGPEFFERAFHTRHLLELTERNPEAALAWLQLAREVGSGPFLSRIEPELFERVFRPSLLTRLLFRKPAAFATILRLVRATEHPQGVDAILTCLSSSLSPLGGYTSILNSLPLSALPDLKWLAGKARDNQVATALRALLRDGGFDAPHELL